MTERDELAARLLAALISRQDGDYPEPPAEEWVQAAFNYADAFLRHKVRNEHPVDPLLLGRKA